MAVHAADHQTLDLFAFLGSDSGESTISEANVVEVEPLDEQVNTESKVAAPINGQPLLFDEIPARVVSTPVRLLSVYVHFENRDDLEDFGRLIGQPVSSETSRIWYPPHLAFSGAIWDPEEAK